MTKTTLTEIFKKYNLTENDVGTMLWEDAEDDHDAHFIVIRDCSALYIIDTCGIEAGSDGFYEGSVYTVLM